MVNVAMDPTVTSPVTTWGLSTAYHVSLELIVPEWSVALTSGNTRQPKRTLTHTKLTTVAVVLEFMPNLLNEALHPFIIQIPASNTEHNLLYLSTNYSDFRKNVDLSPFAKWCRETGSVCERNLHTT
jgi:hypothetical protein